MIDSLISTIVTIRENYFSWIDFPTISLTDVIEIAIIAFLVYQFLVWVKNTRAWNLFKGILVILIFVVVAAIFQMSTILWIAEKVVSVGLIALVVIFRRLVCCIGRHALSVILFFGCQLGALLFL